MTVQTLRVVGMTCGHCVAAVTGAITKLPGVQTVDVDLASGIVTVTSEQSVPNADLAEAIDDAGFELSAP
jgi:copper chaperone